MRLLPNVGNFSGFPALKASAYVWLVCELAS